jgi:pimeloyl-ACP methyl ester carboxylesterase
MTLRQTVLLGAALAAVAATPLSVARGDIIIFPDGFAIEGRVKEQKTWLIDPASGAGISIAKAGKPFWLFDGVRNIFFSPFQLKEALPSKTKPSAENILKLEPPSSYLDMPLGWTVEGGTEWDNRWERDVTLKTIQGAKFKVKQRITYLSPEYVGVDSKDYKWPCYYKTKEIEPQTLRTLLYQHFNKKKEKELDIRLKVYGFLVEAGFFGSAQQELDDMLKEFPKEQSRIAPLKDNLKRLDALELVKALERSNKAGLFDDVEQKLKQYAQNKVDDMIEETAQLRVQAIKDQHDAVHKKLDDAARLLQAFARIVPPSKQKQFQAAADDIIQELNPDTVDRLETFFNIAGDYERATNDKRQPEHNASEVLAFALTGWLRGSDAAENKAEVALHQWHTTRRLLLSYVRNDDPLARKKLLPELQTAKVSVDEAVQILKRLPPVDAHDKINAKPQTLQTKNNGKPITYEVQLPPGYNHGRSWPVLIALHHSEETAAAALARWTDLAALHGYIVVAPQWGKGPKSTYQFSVQEHSAVLETLRDLRRRFQVDSDRVFLFGGEQGGVMAYDVGLSHPDQFTGVMPMAAPPMYFARRYWSNAQYLHMYIMNGERGGFSLGDTQAMFKDFIRCNYPAIYVEYKGRPAEWYGAERTILFDWMNRKRRAYPSRELGKAGEEFKTQRSTDNQFYWLSTSAVQPPHLNSAAGWNPNSKSATLRATLFNNNEIRIKTSGVGPLTVWFGPKFINYAEKVTISINDSRPQKTLVTPDLYTLLETLYETGDRQRLYFAKLVVSG